MGYITIPYRNRRILPNLPPLVPTESQVNLLLSHSSTRFVNSSGETTKSSGLWPVVTQDIVDMSGITHKTFYSL